METPLSTRSLAAPSAQKSAAAHFSRAKNPAALHDITNDSPIVGLHDKTPASTAAKNRRRAGAAPRRTPGSGEALLRGQVKALLHKLQEEEQGCAAAAIVRPACIQALLGVSRSPAQLLAPTPANTPQIGPVSAVREGLLMPDGSTLMPCVLENEESLLPKLQVIAASLPVPPPEDNLGECQRNHALVFDESPGKSDASNGSAVSSSLSLQDSISGSYMDKSSSPEDDSSSAWSIQVHASSEKGDEEDLAVEELGEHTEEDEEELGEHTEEEEERWEDSDDDCFDDLCEEMSRMTVFDDEENAGLPQFEGWHTRFIYNSDDEIEREEVVDAAEARAELGALVLRGTVPEGRHLRFNEEDEE